MARTEKFRHAVAPGSVMARVHDPVEAIPNMDPGKIYDSHFTREDFHYGSLGSLADLLGRNPRPHRHNDFLQIHFITSGSFELRIDEQHWQASHASFQWTL